MATEFVGARQVGDAAPASLQPLAYAANSAVPVGVTLAVLP
jgi:hypothetical protein